MIKESSRNNWGMSLRRAKHELKCYEQLESQHHVGVNHWSKKGLKARHGKGLKSLSPKSQLNKVIS